MPARRRAISAPVERLVEHLRHVEDYISRVPLADIAVREDQFRFAAVYVELQAIRRKLTHDEAPAGWNAAVGLSSSRTGIPLA